MRKKIDYLELCKLVRAGQAPKKIEVLDDIFEWNGKDYKRCSGIAKLFLHETMYFKTLCEEGTDIFIIDEILDQVEKDYLRAVIKPFRDRVKEVIKRKSPISESSEYIRIYYKESNKDRHSISFPDFPKGRMYKGMKVEKPYTLEELGL